MATDPIVYGVVFQSGEPLPAQHSQILHNMLSMCFIWIVLCVKEIWIISQEKYYFLLLYVY